MKATKGNKEYTIDASQKSYYIAQGYDILDDDGKIVEHGAGKSVTYKEYEELKTKYEELKKDYNSLEKENKKLKKEVEGSK